MSNREWTLGKCFVYRAFSPDGALLYIGASTQPNVRFTAHRCRSAWCVSGVKFVVSEFPSVHKARLAEGRAINDENPIHNVDRCKWADGPDFPIEVDPKKERRIIKMHQKYSIKMPKVISAATRAFGFDVTAAHLTRRYGA